MTTPQGDPVNRWATEHYGFADGDIADGGGVTAGPASSQTHLAGRIHVRPSRRRRPVLMASGVLCAALLAGIGGAAVASGDGGPRPDDGQGAISQVHPGGDPGRLGDGPR